MSLWRDPDDVLHCRILSPDKTEWRLISATLCGCGRCFVADQLWLMTRIREEQLGRPRITWLSTIQQDLKHHHLTLPEAADLAQNRPLWRMMLTYGATQS